MLALCDFIQHIFENKVTVACLQAQADLNGDGTDEVLVSSHGTTIQARLLQFSLQLMVLCPKSALYPAAMVAKVCSQEESVPHTMLTILILQNLSQLTLRIIAFVLNMAYTLNVPRILSVSQSVLMCSKHNAAPVMSESVKPSTLQLSIHKADP